MGTPIVGISEGVESGCLESAGPGNSGDTESDGSLADEDRFFRRGIVVKIQYVLCGCGVSEPLLDLLFFSHGAKAASMKVN